MDHAEGRSWSHKRALLVCERLQFILSFLHLPCRMGRGYALNTEAAIDNGTRCLSWQLQPAMQQILLTAVAGE